jgi:hypothetical protein
MTKNFTAIMGLCLTIGCSDGMEMDENIDQVEQEVFSGWTPGNSMTVGMAIFGANTYQWLQTQSVCRGPSSNPCSGTSSAYGTPDSTSNIMGVGIAKNTSHVYAWFADSTVSEGTSTNLSFYHAKQAFTRPSKVGGGLFAMSALIEVDNSDNGSWYYYWQDGGTVYRTVGTSTNASSVSSATAVTTSGTPIVGIAFDSNIPARIYTFYSSGSLNVSTSSLNLAQP